MTIVRPELWQRVYSAKTPKGAARSLRRAAFLFAGLASLICYYGLAVVQALPGAGSMDSFVKGYRAVLPGPLSALFPVILMAAMMSSMDSCVFAFSVSLTKQSRFMMRSQTSSIRCVVVSALIIAGAVSLTIFNALAFAYKLDGVVALLSIPVIMSHWTELPKRLLVTALAVGLSVYTFEIVTGMIDASPAQAFYGAASTAVVLGIWLLARKVKDTQLNSLVER
jgi:Na+/proline symporter